MITFCLGSARQKRAYFSDIGAIVLDNVEVLFCSSEDGYNYFAIGKPPFADFTVAEYLRYMRAPRFCESYSDILKAGNDSRGAEYSDPASELCGDEYGDIAVADKSRPGTGIDTNREQAALLRQCGIRLTKKLGRLSSVQMRIVSYFEKLGDSADKAVVINLDGTEFSAKNAAVLWKFTDYIKRPNEREIYICVTDERFIASCRMPSKSMRFGKARAKTPPAFYTARELSRRVGAKKVALM